MTSVSRNIIALQIRLTFPYFSVAQGYGRHDSGACTGKAAVQAVHEEKGSRHCVNECGRVKVPTGLLVFLVFGCSGDEEQLRVAGQHGRLRCGVMPRSLITLKQQQPLLG